MHYQNKINSLVSENKGKNWTDIQIYNKILKNLPGLNIMESNDKKRGGSTRDKLRKLSTEPTNMKPSLKSLR